MELDYSRIANLYRRHREQGRKVFFKKLLLKSLDKAGASSVGDFDYWRVIFEFSKSNSPRRRLAIQKMKEKATSFNQKANLAFLLPLEHPLRRDILIELTGKASSKKEERTLYMISRGMGLRFELMGETSSLEGVM